MKSNRALSLGIIAFIAAVNLFVARGQQMATGSAKKTSSNSSALQGAKPEPSASDLIGQGKVFYRTLRFKQALAKFEAALKLEPENDEALGLAAVTAFRLDNQVQSRDYFLRRADLPNQKESVKAFSFYRVALTYWREAHDLVAKFGEIVDGKVVFTILERNELDVRYNIENGLEYAGKALAITENFAEAHNIKNLLHSEAALAATDEESAQEHRQKAKECLRRAIELSKNPAGGKSGDIADFSLPTIRIAEFARTKEEEEKLEDPMMKLIEGGKPLKRMQPAFPTVKPSKPATDQSNPSTRGVTPDGGTSSPGMYRGAYTTDRVKIEVLISTSGEVVFAHVVDGRSELNGSAILAARNWRFEPAKFEDNPVQVSGVITFDLKPGRSKP
jgi:tetratricopeptide (TPR) repeat protein